MTSIFLMLSQIKNQNPKFQKSGENTYRNSRILKVIFDFKFPDISDLNLE